jgi:hypothetical protein
MPNALTRQLNVVGFAGPYRRLRFFLVRLCRQDVARGPVLQRPLFKQWSLSKI